jgi:hypothetical protein
LKRIWYFAGQLNFASRICFSHTHLTCHLVTLFYSPQIKNRFDSIYFRIMLRNSGKCDNIERTFGKWFLEIFPWQ